MASSLMVDEIEVPEIDSAFLMSLLQDSPILDQSVDQDDKRLIHVIQSLEAEISPISVTNDYVSVLEPSTTDDYYGESRHQRDGQDCSMTDDIDLSWIDMEMVTSLDCGDSDLTLWYMEESYVRDDDLYNVDHYAQGYSYGVGMEEYEYGDSHSLWQES